MIVNIIYHVGRLLSNFFLSVLVFSDNSNNSSIYLRTIIIYFVFDRKSIIMYDKKELKKLEKGKK